MDGQRSSDRIQYPHHDFGRDGYGYHEQHKQHDGAMGMGMGMGMPSLSTGQGFYTVESLQGVSAVPPPPCFIPHPVEEGADDDEERSRHMRRRNGWYYHANQFSIPPTGTTAMVDGRRQSAFGMHPPHAAPPPLLSHPRTSSSFVPDPRIVALHTQQRENLYRQNFHHRENIRSQNIVERPPRGWAPSLPPPPPPPPWAFEHRRTDMRHDRSHSRQRLKPKTQYPKVATSRGKAFGSDSSANVAKVVAVRQRGRHTDESLDKHVTRKRHKKQPDNEKHVQKPNNRKDVEEPDNVNNVEKASKDEAEKLRQEHREGKGMNRYEAKITDEEVVIEGDDVKNMYTSEGNNVNKVVKMMVLDEVKSEVAQMVVEGDVIMEGKETILAGNDITAVCASSKTEEVIADVTDVAFVCASTESKEIVVDKATVGVTNATIATSSAETKEVVIKETDG